MFLIGGDDEDIDWDDVELINTKLENLHKLKFDDQKWEIPMENFIIHDNRVLGSGNFGKVCLATVSNKLIRDENDILMNHDQSLNNSNMTSNNPASRLMNRLSIRRSDSVVRRANEIDMENVSEPLLMKDERRIKVAAKMVKGKLYEIF